MLENSLPEAAMVRVNMAPELPGEGGGAMKIAFFSPFLNLRPRVLSGIVTQNDLHPRMGLSCFCKKCPEFLLQERCVM